MDKEGAVKSAITCVYELDDDLIDRVDGDVGSGTLQSVE